MPAIQILTSVLAVILVMYVIVLIALAFAAQPMRMHMISLIDKMLSEDHWNEDERNELFMLRDHGMSFLIGLLVPVAVIGVITDDVLGRPAKNHVNRALSEDPRFAQIVWRFFASLAAANPLAAAVSIVFMLISVMVGVVFKHSSAKVLFDQAVEEPTLRALERFQPTTC